MKLGLVRATAVLLVAACGSEEPPAAIPDDDAGADASGPIDAATPDAAAATDAPADRTFRREAVNTDPPGPPSALAPLLPEAPSTETLCTPPAPWMPLPYLVTAAMYSRVLDRMIVLPATDRAVHVLDPVTCEDRRIPLARLGLSLSLHADGQRVAVGHDGYLTLVDLRAGTALPPVPLPVPASEVAFEARDRVHVFTRAGSLVKVPLWNVDGSGVLNRPLLTIDADGHLRMSPDGRSLFWVGTSSSLLRIDPDSGGPLRTAFGSPTVGICGELFVTDDSQHLITGCGAVLRLAAGTEEDFRPVAMIEASPTQRLQHLDSLAAQGLLITIRAAPSSGGQPDDETTLRLHDARTWTFTRTIPLPTFEVAAAQPGGPVTTAAAHGRAVFVRSDESKYHVLATVGRLGVPGVATIAPDQVSAPVIPLSATARTLPPPRMPPPATRIAASTRPLEGDVIDAGFSRALDWLVVASSRPASALRLINPDGGQSETIPLPGRPHRLWVREDGLLAAAIHDLGMTVVDLTTGSVLWRSGGSVRQVAFGAHPRMLYEAGGRPAWLDLDTGARQPVPLAGFPPFSPAVLVRFLVQPAGATIYLVGDDLARHEGDGATRTASYDLRLFGAGSSFAACGRDMTMVPGGRYLVIDCGRVFRLDASAPADLRYAGPFDGLAAVSQVLHSNRLDRFLSLPQSYRTPSGFESTDQELWVHEPRLLALERRVTWKAAEPRAPRLTGRYLFERANGRLLIVAGNPEGNVLLAVDP